MSENLLENSSFNASFRNVDGVGELAVAEFWWPWWVDGGKPEGPAPWRRPEYKPEVKGVGRGRTLDNQGQKWFNTWAPHYGGIYQQVPATPGHWYKLTAWVYLWGSSQDDPDVAIPPWPKMSGMVGINGWGRTDMQHRTTVWGKEELDRYNQWLKVECIAQAYGNRITAALGTIAEFGTKHVDAYWDQAQLVCLGAWGTVPAEPGQPSDPEESQIRAWARQEAIRVLGDAAQAVAI